MRKLLILLFSFSTTAIANISEIRFNNLIERVERVYGPVVLATKGVPLRFDRAWRDDEFGLSAGERYDRSGELPRFDHWLITVNGGFARHPDVNEDVFVLGLCHEVGHVVGGYNILGPTSLSIRSPEAQADYFSTLKCMRRVFEGFEVRTNLEGIPLELTQQCRSRGNQNEISTCLRSIKAALILTTALAKIENKTIPLLNRSDRRRVSRSITSGYPSIQCRLDTFVAGAVCTRDVDENVSDSDETLGTCHSRNGDRVGVRPACWFREDT